jgi:uncharacterized membrane protein (UPF0127 family)
MLRRFPHVRGVKFVPLLLLVLVLASGCRDGKSTAAVSTATSAPPTLAPLQGYLPHAQQRLQIMKLFVGLKEINAELALKPVEIYTGMMWRTNMPDGEGMLFVFSDATPRAFYMRNTLVPLSLAYIDPDGVIQEIHDLQPRNETSVPSKSENIQYVLEVPQGWFTRNQIVPGTVVRSQYGELKRIFSFKPLPR